MVCAGNFHASENETIGAICIIMFIFSTDGMFIIYSTVWDSGIEERWSINY